MPCNLLFHLRHTISPGIKQIRIWIYSITLSGFKTPTGLPHKLCASDFAFTNLFGSGCCHHEPSFLPRMTRKDTRCSFIRLPVEISDNFHFSPFSLNKPFFLQLNKIVLYLFQTYLQLLSNFLLGKR